jgi:hypothetical protein
MNPNISPTIDTQAPIRDHEAASVAETRESEPDSITPPRPAVGNHEPSPSERLYEAYRLWAFTGR